MLYRRAGQPLIAGSVPRAAHTLIELAIALALMAVLLSMAVPRLGTLRDRASVHSASAEVAAILAQHPLNEEITAQEGVARQRARHSREQT